MTTRIDFVESSGHPSWESRLTSYCSTPSKEVFQKMFPHFWIASYRHRGLFCFSESITLLNVKSEEKDYLTNEELHESRKYAREYHSINLPKVVSIDSSLDYDQLIKEIKKTNLWENHRYDYSNKPRESFYLFKRDWKPTTKNMAKLYLRVMINRIKGNAYEKKDEKIIGWKPKSLNQTVDILLEDEPLREICEVLLRRKKGNLTQKILRKYISDQRLYRR
jgi:hypothetical protein